VDLPSGLVDLGESPEQAAQRELLEETGYAASEVEMLGPMIPEAGRLSNQLWTCFARGVRRVGDPEPGIEVVTYSMTELAEATKRGEFCHAPHVGSVLLAALHGKIKVS
jgi:8-oxo-dGTP pyrophosphatase MutT (NUDIX family)